MRKLLFTIVISLASLFSGAAQAYQYTYVSQVFDVEFNSYQGGPGGGGQVTIQPSFILASIYSPTLLAAGASWVPGTSLKMERFVDNMVVQTLTFPDVNADPGMPPGSVWNPNYAVNFSIGAVDANGLPTLWDISLQRQLNTPTGREDLNNFFISNVGDSVSGGYQGFAEFSGASGAPGTWTMGVAAVPEPETYAMLVAGLGLVGAVARRRQ